MWVAGMDGCRAGWLVVLRDLRGEAEPRAFILARFAQVLELPEQPSIIAVDMPIGLPDSIGPGGRGCDVAVRAVLGKRQSSVFAVPARAAVMEQDYRQACATAMATSQPARKVAKQCFNIFPKIREVDAVMTPQLQQRVHEVHPEAAFWAMNGCTPLGEPKKLKSRPYEPGLELRRNLLRRAGLPAPLLEQFPFRAAEAGPDDLLDACACSITAMRIAEGNAIRFPQSHAPISDGRGLAMAIWA